MVVLLCTQDFKMAFDSNIFGEPPEWKSRSLGPDPTKETIEDFNNLFSEYVSSKRVAIVGPASSLDGLGLGKKIDDYDVVVRVNLRQPLSPEMISDFGSRSDVLLYNMNATCCVALHNHKSWLNKAEWRILSDLRSVEYSAGYLRKYHPAMYDLMKETEASEKQGFHMLGADYTKTMMRNIGTVANAGLMYVLWLLQYDVKELFICGMSFYNMGEWGDCYNESLHKGEYYNNYSSRTQPAGFLTKEQGHHNARGDIHDQEKQITYFAKLLEIYYNNPITLDPYLTKAFEVEKSSKE